VSLQLATGIGAFILLAFRIGFYLGKRAGTPGDTP
jgi:hypothetical protein